MSEAKKIPDRRHACYGVWCHTWTFAHIEQRLSAREDAHVADSHPPGNLPWRQSGSDAGLGLQAWLSGCKPSGLCTPACGCCRWVAGHKHRCGGAAQAAAVKSGRGTRAPARACQLMHLRSHSCLITTSIELWACSQACAGHAPGTSSASQAMRRGLRIAAC